jgi:hypothetical protein
MEILVYVWLALAFGCLITFFVVTTVLIGVKPKQSSSVEPHPGSSARWAFSSIAGLLVWALLLAMLSGFGLSHNSLSVGKELVASVIWYGGPALYIYSGYRRIRAINALSQDSSF